MIKAVVIIFIIAFANAAAIAGLEPAVIAGLEPAVIAGLEPTAFPGTAFGDPAVEAVTDKLLFHDSMAVFLKAKAAKDPPYLIWEDTGCSYSPDKPLGFNFLDSCKRHDFGYDNYRKQERFTEPNRKRIDDLFEKDLYNECNKYSFLKKYTCRGAAELYYYAVRMFGRIVGDIRQKIGLGGAYQHRLAREGL